MISPNPIERLLVLEDRDGPATHMSVKRRATIWTMMNSTGRADMDLGTWERGLTTRTMMEDKNWTRQET